MSTFLHYLGAIGWSFGGSMSYMMVVGYSHSPQSKTVLYGFANLFVIGFLWAALGGAGTALPAFLVSVEYTQSTPALTHFFTPVCVVFVGWSLQAVLIDRILATQRMERHESPLYWFDTDWVAALVAIVSVVIVILFRGGIDIATALILYMGVGVVCRILIIGECI